MRAIWKVNLHEALKDSEYAGKGQIELPQGAEIRAVQYQRGDLCLWAEVDTEAELVKRTVHIVGTGHDLKQIPFDGAYVTTVQDQSELYTWHVYVSR